MKIATLSFSLLLCVPPVSAQLFCWIFGLSAFCGNNNFDPDKVCETVADECPGQQGPPGVVGPAGPQGPQGECTVASTNV